jgi:hypothetical protein
MKTSLSLSVLAFFVLFNSFTPPVDPPAKTSAKLFQGYELSVMSSNANIVDVYVAWNTLSTPNNVTSVTIIDPLGFSTYTVTMMEQPPRMTLVSGVLTASGWRCNFVNQNNASDYVILNGTLTTY